MFCLKFSWTMQWMLGIMRWFVTFFFVCFRFHSFIFFISVFQNSNLCFSHLWNDSQRCLRWKGRKKIARYKYFLFFNSFFVNLFWHFGSFLFIVALGVHVGVYSSEYEWSQTVCTYSGLNDLPQWCKKETTQKQTYTYKHKLTNH